MRACIEGPYRVDIGISFFFFFPNPWFPKLWVSFLSTASLPDPSFPSLLFPFPLPIPSQVPPLGSSSTSWHIVLVSFPEASPGLFQSCGLLVFLLGKGAHQLQWPKHFPPSVDLSSLLGSESENGLLLHPYKNCWLAPSQRYLEEMAKMPVSLNCNHQLVLKGLLKGSKWRGQCCSVCRNPGCFDGWYWVRVLTGSCSVARLNEGSS